MSRKQRDSRTKRSAKQRALEKKRGLRDAKGRLHLELHRDPNGRLLGLTLTEPIFKERWQNEIATGAANTAHASFSAMPTRHSAEALGQNMMSATSKMAEAALARASEPVACQSGCAHCCHQAVGVTAPEVFAIDAWLRSTLTPEARSGLVARVQAVDGLTRGMPLGERFSPRYPCPFLDGQRCSIYEARPLACRAKNSLDQAACQRALEEPQARAEFLAGRFPIPCFPEPTRTMNAVSAGVQLALHELHGLSVEPLELVAALSVLWQDPDTVERQWLAGDDPFRGARGADVTADPAVRALAGTLT